MPKPLSPTSEHLYERILTRAFGGLDQLDQLKPDVASWTNSNKHLLKAALKRARPDATNLIAAIDSSMQYEIKRVAAFLTEEECVRYEQAARELPDQGRAAIALLPLASALRATEILTITRLAMLRAAKSGDLLVLRKGGEEQVLKLDNSKALFDALLHAPSAVGRCDIDTPRTPGRQWDTLGEILSPGERVTQYHILHKIIRNVGRRAQIETPCRPHLLRHACATRLMRSGAPMAVISKFLNHKNIATTQRYLHASAEDATKYLREF